MKSVITIFSFFVLLGQANANQSVPSGLYLFCSSGGFLYNNLDVKETGGQVNFNATGDWINVNDDLLATASDLDITAVRLSVSEGNCTFSNTNGVSLVCLPQSLTIELIDRAQGRSETRSLGSVQITALESRFVIEQNGIQLVSQELRTCADLTGLD